MSEPAKASVSVWIDNQLVECDRGEPLLMAMLRSGIGWSTAGDTDNPRGAFCNMGVCQECVVRIDKATTARACLTPVEEGRHYAIER